MNDWDKPIRLGEIGRGGLELSLAPDAEARAAIARQLDLKSLSALKADLVLKPWLDGVELTGRFRAVNNSYYLIDCYMEVRRTLYKPKHLQTFN